jgi:hypothetical protein
VRADRPLKTRRRRARGRGLRDVAKFLFSPSCPPRARWRPRKASRGVSDRATASIAPTKERFPRGGVDRLERGDDVPGGFGKPVDLEKALLEAGFTKDDLRHCQNVYEASEAFGFDQFCKATREVQEQAGRRLARNMANMAGRVGKNPGGGA